MRQILNDRELLDALAALVCRGPVRGTEGPSNPFPGHDATAGTDDESSPNIVPWAAAGTLKNVALESSPDFLKFVEPYVVPCACRMKRSKDWLEANKADGLIGYTRRKDPCWFGDPTAATMTTTASMPNCASTGFSSTAKGTTVRGTRRLPKASAWRWMLPVSRR